MQRSAPDEFKKRRIELQTYISGLSKKGSIIPELQKPDVSQYVANFIDTHFHSGTKLYFTMYKIYGNDDEPWSILMLFGSQVKIPENRDLYHPAGGILNGKIMILKREYRNFAILRERNVDL